RELDPLLLDPPQHRAARLLARGRPLPALHLRHRTSSKNESPRRRRAPEAASPPNDRASLAQRHGPADGPAAAADDVAEPPVEPLHRLVPALRPGVELAAAALRRPRDRR